VIEYIHITILGVIMEPEEMQKYINRINDGENLEDVLEDLRVEAYSAGQADGVESVIGYG
jgi:hypothetical protein